MSACASWVTTPKTSMDEFENEQERAEFIEAEKADVWHDQQVDRESKEDSFLKELLMLQRQLEGVISLIENSLCVETTAEEQKAFKEKYGEGTFIVGDYVIKKFQ